ncbi:MAG TPA: TRAP transporter substrate-binding protein [Candidatus Acidoferrales bacterium]|nr:TRAP transporter substrate-binding protein [Candidatus Acidoferrales bacterium]
MIQVAKSSRAAFLAGTTAASAAVLGFPALVRADDTRTLSFAHVNPPGTGYDIIATTFATKLLELSGGTLQLQIFPNGQLGQEEQLAQKIRAGSVDLAITSTANFSSAMPAAGVFSLEYLYPTEDSILSSIRDPGINDTFRTMVRENLPGVLALGLFTQSFRNMYASFPIKSVADIKGKRVRVQATKTEDAFMTAYGAIPVHVQFNGVGPALKDGTVQVAENGIQVYLSTKHYEVAPVLSLTQHEANNSTVIMSENTWDGLTPAQQRFVVQAFETARHIELPRGAVLDHAAIGTLEGLGVTVIDNVDKESFAEIARPIIDAQAALLGTYATEIVAQIRALS